MDAAKKLFTKTALFFAIAVLVAAPALAQPVLNVSTPQVSLPQPGGVLSVNVAVSSSVADTPIEFSINRGPNDSWYNVLASQTVTPANLTITLNQQGISPLEGKVTLKYGPSNTLSTEITVRFVPGGGGGGGTITASPSNFLTFNLASGSASTQFVQLSTSSSGTVGFTVGTPTPVGNSQVFASASVNTFNVSLNNPATLTVNASAAGIGSGTHTNTIAITPTGGTTLTIQVQLIVGSGSSTGSLQVSSNQLFFTYPSGTTSQNLTVSSSNGVNFFNVSASSSGNWLLTSNGGISATGVQIGPNALFATLNTGVISQFAQGTYYGTLTLTNPSNSLDTTTVNVQLTVNSGTLLNLNPSKSSIQFNAPGGSSALLQDSVSFYANNGISTSYSIAGYTSNGNWLSAQANGGFLPHSITVTANPTNLPAGTYQGSVTVNFSGGVQGQQTIPVTLQVGTGGGIITSGVSPTSLRFVHQAGSSQSVPLQFVTVGGSGSISVSSNQSWLAGTGSGSAPGTVSVYVIPGGQTGTVTGTLSITTSAGTAQVPVTLEITTGTAVRAEPLGTINKTFEAGASPYDTSVTITSTDNNQIPISVTSGASWVTVGTPTGSGFTPTTFTVRVNPAGLPNGLNTTNLTVTASGAVNTPLTIPVVALVSGSTSGGSGNLTVSPTALNFSAAVGGSQPQSQQLTVSAASSTQFQMSTNVNWISLSPVAGTVLYTNQNVTVSVNTSGLAQGTHSGNILLTSNSLPQSVPVTLVIGGGSVTVAPTSISLSVNNGQSGGVQGLEIKSVSGNPVEATIKTATTSGGNWLSAGIANDGTIRTPTTLYVSPQNFSSLGAGTYSGTITISPQGGQQVQVPVSLTVSTNNVTASTKDGGTSLTFNYRISDSAPASQAITVSGTGNFTATAQSTGNWLSVSPGSGTAPATNTVNASVNTSSLSAGTYNGTIVVAGSGTTTGSTTISVQLVVTAPPVTITRVGNAASYLSGSISPGEIITIFGVNLGPSTPVGMKLDESGRVATTIGGVQVLVNGFRAPMVFASATQVSAVVPYEVKGQLSANVQVSYQGQTSNGSNLQVAATAPGIFTANSSGTGPAAIIYPNPTLASATRGDVIAFYMTGEGETNPSGVTGKVTTVSAVAPLTPAPLLTPVVLIDGQPAEVLFAGQAPGVVSGVMQLNVRIPAGARSGELQLVVRLNDVSSQPGVTLAVR